MGSGAALQLRRQRNKRSIIQEGPNAICETRATKAYPGCSGKEKKVVLVKAAEPLSGLRKGKKSSKRGYCKTFHQLNGSKSQRNPRKTEKEFVAAARSYQQTKEETILKAHRSFHLPTCQTSNKATASTSCPLHTRRSFPASPASRPTWSRKRRGPTPPPPGSKGLESPGSTLEEQEELLVMTT